MQKPIDIARKYIARGWSPVPIPFKAKGPKETGWQNLKIDETNVAQHFNGVEQNIGIILGPVSGGLTDVDLDCDEAVALAPALLPRTEAIFGRQSKPRSHYLYMVERPEKPRIQLQDNLGGTIIELRCGGKTGAQTVFPGSTHPSGEAIEWVNEGDAAAAGWSELKRAVVVLGVGVMLWRHWPQRGRHDACCLLGAFLARVGWEPEEITNFIEILLIQMGRTGADIKDGMNAARDFAENHLRDGTGWGLPKLVEMFGSDCAAKVARFLEYKEDLQEENLEKFNTRFCILPVAGKARILEFKKNKDRTETVFYSPGDFKILMDKEKIKVLARDKEGKEVNKSVGLGTWWLGHPKRRQYEGIIFKPGQSPIENKEYLNLWQGWGIEPAAGSWNLMREHIRDVLAARNEEHFQYILKWVAWTFQNPGRPAEVVLVFRGGRGAGKGVFAREIKKAFGQHGVHISSAGQLAGRFNAHLMDCALLFADEAFWPGDKASEGTLKRMITEDVLFIERKGVDGFEVDNNLHIIMASNVDWIVPAGTDERRFAVFDASNAVAQNETYFAPLYAEIASGGTAAMLHDLLRMDLKGWHPRRDVPKSDALIDQQNQSLAPNEQWWFDMLQDGWLPGAQPANPRLAPSEMLFEVARTKVPGLRFMSDHMLGRALRKFGANRDGDYRINGKRAWLFPPLAEAREAWAAKIPTVWSKIEGNEWMPDPM